MNLDLGSTLLHPTPLLLSTTGRAAVCSRPCRRAFCAAAGERHHTKAFRCSAQPQQHVELACSRAAATPFCNRPHGTPVQAPELPSNICSTLSRRHALQLSLAASALLVSVSAAEGASASALPAAVDRAWEAIGGGPADLIFPDSFLGRWDVASALRKLDLPQGPELLSLSLSSGARRAQDEDLNRVINYSVRWIRNSAGQVIMDRRYNLTQLLNMYMGPNALQDEDVDWNPDNPNQLSIRLRAQNVRADTRVTRRSQDKISDGRIDTSEFYQQTIYLSASNEPRVKASQCFTKYRFRDDAAAAADDGVNVVATQVVSDYLTAADSNENFFRARNRPVVIYTYQMEFTKA